MSAAKVEEGWLLGLLHQQHHWRREAYHLQQTSTGDSMDGWHTSRFRRGPPEQVLAIRLHLHLRLAAVDASSTLSEKLLPLQSTSNGAVSHLQLANLPQACAGCCQQDCIRWFLKPLNPFRLNFVCQNHIRVLRSTGQLASGLQSLHNHY